MKYRVNTPENRCGIQVEADVMDVTFNGALLLGKGEGDDYKLVAVYSAGNWTCANQVIE